MIFILNLCISCIIDRNVYIPIIIPWKLDFLQIRIFTAFLLYCTYIFLGLSLWMDVLILQKWSWTTTPFEIYVTSSFNEHALRETKLGFKKKVCTLKFENQETNNMTPIAKHANSQKTILQKPYRKKNSTNFVNDGVIFQIRCHPGLF